MMKNAHEVNVIREAPVSGSAADSVRQLVVAYKKLQQQNPEMEAVRLSEVIANLEILLKTVSKVGL